MTLEQFKAIATLISARGGVTEQGAMLVLVDGMKPKEAAESLGVPVQTVQTGMRRFKRALELAKTATQ
jgi:DNA-directed RNA polymerase specialized sigma24 family protein